MLSKIPSGATLPPRPCRWSGIESLFLLVYHWGENRKCPPRVGCVHIGLIIGQGSSFMAHGILVKGQVHSLRVMDEAITRFLQNVRF